MAKPNSRLSDLQIKLIRLALDPAAAPGEIQNCAIKLIESWRREGKSMEDLFGGDAPSVTQAQKYWTPDYGLCVMQFGKHKGEMFKDIPPDYLRWLMSALKEELPNTRYYERNLQLIEDIESFLEQG